MSNMQEYSIDPFIWHAERELLYTPKHFTLAKSLVTWDSKRWIINNLRGRVSFAVTDNMSILGPDYDTVPAFEDPQEAIMYELMWSS